MAQGAAFVHADDVGQAFAQQIMGEFMDGRHRGTGGLGDLHSVTHMITVAVSHQDERYRS